MMKYLSLYGSVILLDVGRGAFSTQKLQFNTSVNNFQSPLLAFRGVNYATKSPSRLLKKECATILESMKVRSILA